VQELGGSTARNIAKVASGNTPSHRLHAQFINGGWLGVRNPLFQQFQLSFLVREFELFQEFHLFQEFVKFKKSTNYKFQVLRSLLGDQLQTGHQVVRKQYCM